MVSVTVLCLSAEFAEYEVKPTIYTYTELQAITKSFSMKLGQGAFGAVYKVGAISCTAILQHCLIDLDGRILYSITMVENLAIWFCSCS